MTPRSWDCHTHVFGPYDRYPLDPNRSYTPPPASVADLQAHLDALGIEQVVLVQPHSHGTDTQAMMAALNVLGGRARGVTVVDPGATSVDELTDLRRQGIRGVRVNVHTARSSMAVPEVHRIVEMLKGSGLHLQLFAPGSELVELVPQLDRSVPIVVDHMGMVLHGNGHRDAMDVIRALCEHDCWIKLSAPERMGVQPDGGEARRVVEEFATLAPHRIVWGSDWPHSALTHDRPVEETEPFRAVDDRARLEMLERWLGADLYGSTLCDNPESLYA
ncbi:amidohydrolase family protein [Mycolicibacterium sediminis]|uniref:2-pyrone-4,6-dicarboxylate hydrolase n=1 Tax=Mycolicibacterium sediminis TaxID=1286180 RepID=A0A7I7QVI5_9MYCO|nr:amidohydrolase family protein [Mycolicibacterium sediminis]BBY30007.1 2-pyrone-4,6-dicarboxylate hydrolase [Mycolicibacterium sediminis]